MAIRKWISAVPKAGRIFARTPLAPDRDPSKVTTALLEEFIYTDFGHLGALSGGLAVDSSRNRGWASLTPHRE